jgi:hypothetical protein
MVFFFFFFFFFFGPSYRERGDFGGVTNRIAVVTTVLG